MNNAKFQENMWCSFKHNGVYSVGRTLVRDTKEIIVFIDSNGNFGSIPYTKAVDLKKINFLTGIDPKLEKPNEHGVINRVKNQPEKIDGFTQLHLN